MDPNIKTTTFEDRHLGIGGSDIGNLIGNSEYKCSRKLHYDKNRIPKDYAGDDRYLRRGKRLEKAAFDYFREKSGLPARHSSELQHSSFIGEQDFLRVNVDGFIVSEGDSIVAPVEVKTLGEDSFVRYKKHGLPDDYISQIQWAMGITRCSYGYFVIYHPNEDDIVYFRIEFNQDLFEALKQKAAEFWRSFKLGIPPPRKRIEEDELVPKACRSCDWRKTCKGIGSNGKFLQNQVEHQLVSIEF